MKDNLVSVIIPTYRGSDVISRAVESVMNQTYQNIEIIVVDDNDPDSEDRAMTEQVMTSFRDSSSVVYLKHSVNKNGAAARNTGIDYSHGEYIAFLDADDWFLPRKIESQIAFLKSHQEYDACYCLAQRNSQPIPTIPFEGSLTKELLMMQTNMFTPSLFFHSSVLNKINGFDETYKRHQDYEMLLRFFREGFKIGCVQEILLELGTSENRNSIDPDKLLLLKDKFLKDFNSDIEKLESDKSGIKKQIYALHYGKVFLAYILRNKYGCAIKLSHKYFWFSPYYFTLDFRNRCCGYVKRKMQLNRVYNNQ